MLASVPCGGVRLSGGWTSGITRHGGLKTDETHAVYRDDDRPAIAHPAHGQASWLRASTCSLRVQKS